MNKNKLHTLIDKIYIHNIFIFILLNLTAEEYDIEQCNHLISDHKPLRTKITGNFNNIRQKKKIINKKYAKQLTEEAFRKSKNLNEFISNINSMREDKHLKKIFKNRLETEKPWKYELKQLIEETKEKKTLIEILNNI